MPQVACGATHAPSLTLRVGKWDDSNCGDASAQAEFPGGVQRVVSEIGFVFPARFHPRFVLSHNMPTINITNVTSKLALFWPFFSCRAISLLRIHWPLTTILSLHAPRLTPHASRLKPHQRGQVVRGPSPAGYTSIHRPPNCQRPSAARSRRAARPCSVCHRNSASHRIWQFPLPNPSV